MRRNIKKCPWYILNWDLKCTQLVKSAIHKSEMDMNLGWDEKREYNTYKIITLVKVYQEER